MALSSIARPKVGVITATGGDVVREYPDLSTGFVWKAHTFTASGDFVVTAGTDEVEFLLVAGGGAGGHGLGGTRGGAGGGGAGGVIESRIVLSPDTYPVVIGNGGAVGTGVSGGTGSNSTAFGLTASGGGGGARAGTDATGVPTAGGSGGGHKAPGSHSLATGAGGVLGQGRQGGAPAGGGYNGLGQNGGLVTSIAGVPFYVAYGGDGGRGQAHTQQPTTPAMPNTGAGGSGGGNWDAVTSNAQGGGSGVFVVRYRLRRL